MTRAVWITSGADGTEHVVTDEQMTAGHAAESPDPEGDTTPARGPGGNHDAWHPVGRL
ncbi:MAG: hypothetical protein ACT4NY_10370 [Pseudonocardiales bacterium]